MANIDLAIPVEDGRIITGLEQGTSTGRAMIYLHGAPGSCQDHRSFDDVYQQQGIRLVAINRPGTGGTSPHKDWNALTFADDLRQVMDHLAIDKASIIGFSAGGIYGCGFSFRYPERVEKLVLISSTGPFDHPQLAGQISESVRAFYEGAKHDPEALLQQLAEVDTPEALCAMLESIVSPEDQQVFSLPNIRADFLSAFADVLNQGLAGFVKEVFNVASPWGFSPEAITVETRLWHGLNDQNVSLECCKYLAEAIPTATATYVKGAGHYFSFEQWPELLQQVMAD